MPVAYAPNLTPKQIAKFWSRVLVIEDEDSCWLWQAGRTKAGYGIIVFDYEQHLAHRLSLAIHAGPLTSDKPFALHTCNNPPCVRPKHLYAGTQHDNMQQASRDGRVVIPGLFGEAHGHATLYDAEVNEIRELYSTGKYTQQQLADLFGCSQSNISYIVRRETRVIQCL